MARHPLFAGKALRALRTRRALRQADMAQALGISASYLSQLENDERPLTAGLVDALGATFPVDWADLAPPAADELAEALRAALADPHLAASNPSAPHALTGPPSEQIERLARQFPDLARQVVQLHGLYTQTRHRLDMMDDTIGASLAAGGRLPWEEARDWFHQANNYVDTIDRGAEELAARIGGGEPSPDIAQMQHWLSGEGVSVVWRGGGPVRRYDPERRVLTLDSIQPLESSRFQLAYQVCVTALADEIASIVDAAPLRSEAARHLLAVGLGNYAAGALTMPYEAFRQAARALRHDVDRLRQPFHTSFEQTCHRLSTLQRPQARGIPVFFYRVDMAGNVTKRHSATRLQFGRYGGACPLWIVHEAVAIPDRIHVQLAEMPDKVRYVSIAKGLVKPSGSYYRPPRRYAVALGCEAALASEFVYADGLNLTSEDAVARIGASCRTCPRDTCDQRAFPPSDKAIRVDPAERDRVPYRIVAD
ncbi:helix-turn-helix domain-containing protein [Novosphingobium pituita]|uniref:XRE family transcriptional regulator n=1 Tax=Novosphingobium pituita TaxID=3056842 RepID=A0ABQ6PB35_9SPHN|nr:helix-turn-helix transcriptional regulator [Novosphingobium sp. IK01]MDK4807564.1 short-chain fatty acyl-CoA regulator family protein [Novosphingobium aromaticivorans]GMM61634.1 XRE family transcriptional regulator [Novosphingobium sp. IK01]HIQ19281.1 XRE family transcriptional regulator [Novosphingobium capsulatum]